MLTEPILDNLSRSKLNNKPTLYDEIKQASSRIREMWGAPREVRFGEAPTSRARVSSSHGSASWSAEHEFKDAPRDAAASNKKLHFWRIEKVRMTGNIQSVRHIDCCELLLSRVLTQALTYVVKRVMQGHILAGAATSAFVLLLLHSWSAVTCRRPVFSIRIPSEKSKW